jgi:hypothetical protein
MTQLHREAEFALATLYVASQPTHSVWCIRVLIPEGRLPKFRLGKEYVFDPADLRAFVAEEKERQQ